MFLIFTMHLWFINSPFLKYLLTPEARVTLRKRLKLAKYSNAFHKARETEISWEGNLGGKRFAYIFHAVLKMSFWRPIKNVTHHEQSGFSISVLQKYCC